ncbi:MAG: ACP S-malonyltransferase [Campylobacter sputorum]|uniref:ACP S-malonyltransferase n=1 Tax=Campylobacter sputorum TaxID=206 RepID=UPI000B77B8E0|nr:ACP S-malonyltransferase [Campylobacter sputorum]ASM39023.1 malonyl-CoA-[acp] transacylase [Campylobacter sputorum bv. paraureolyticus LMG 11764]MDY6120327.1 ACP S-malonyltransferase [Campylobacter sputorum]
MDKIGFIFPGQGSQKPGMGFDIYEEFSVARELLDTSSDLCKIDFKKLLFSKNENLNISEFTQPAIVLNSFMILLALQERLNLKQSLGLGHSLGEFAALGANGAIELREVIRLVNLRGKFMQEACSGKDASMMVVLDLDDEKVEQICDNARKDGAQIWAANYNCNGQIVIAGLKKDLANAETVFKEAGAKRAMLLNMSVASHCPILNLACDKLVNEIEPIIKNSFLKVISNVSSKSYNTKNEALVLLKEQLVKPVLYKQSIQNIENEVDFFVEIGSSVLKGMNKKITQKPTYAIFDIKSLDEFCKIMEEK